jgi:hypothetical protein
MAVIQRDTQRHTYGDYLKWSRTLAMYRLEDGRYGRPIYQELKGKTLLSAAPSVSIDWDRTMTLPV